MKRLYLVRHAKSDWENINLRDSDRPLSKRGEKNAPAMGKRIKEREIYPELILSSPALRAVTTCEEIAKVIGYEKSGIKIDKRIYHADEGSLFTVTSGISDQYESVMLFGHNPGFTDFANTLLSKNIMNIPTCGVVSIKLKIDLWKSLKPECGKMEFFDFPKNFK